MFTVGAFARMAGVSARMLRSYDADGLFHPAWVDRSSGYRYYSPAQLPKLRRILALRDVGLSRAEVRELIGGGSDLRETLERRRRELEAERRDLERQLAILQIRIAPGATGDTDVVVRHLAAETVAAMDPAVVGGDIAAAFYELEARVRDLGARAHRPPGAIPDEDAIFVPLRRTIPSTDRIGVGRLPATRAATILHLGRYATLPRAHADLVAWVEAAGLAPSGPLRILYLQFGAEPELRLPRSWTVDRGEELVTELQLPIDDGSAGSGRRQIGGQPASFEKVS
jgi:DNA-binding transcriptional MerR regulator